MPSPPGNVAKVHAVIDPVIDERREVMLVDGVPQAKFRRYPIAEVFQDRQAVASLGCSCQPHQLGRLHMLEQAHVGRGGRVMKLVHDDDVEVFWIQMREIACVQALD